MRRRLRRKKLQLRTKRILLKNQPTKMARIKSKMSKQTICKTKTHNYEKRCQEPKWVTDIFFIWAMLKVGRA